MCGITGLIHKSDRPVDLSILQKMNRTLVHRGPDDEGYFVEGSVGLGHRRLSIIDLASGHQPLQTPDKRYTIVFNGEIYNFLELRSELEKKGISFQTRSDTEVLLALYSLEGEKALNRLNGMFSFAVWDQKERKLFAARDRMGKKPFYYRETPSHFAFASECKAFKAHPDFKSELDHEALAHFFQYEYVPAPYAIFRGVKKLPAGCFLIHDEKGLTIKSYWDVPLSDGNKADVSEPEACERILELLDRAVEYRTISDVPLGVFLSGGVDSSAVVALMARHRAGKEIKTFSVNFNEPSFDESAYSSFIAGHFNTDHHAQTLSPKTLIDILPEVAGFLDEPFADYSIIPTYLLSKFTRKSVTVALGGDGGDELFAGYPTFYADRVARWFGRLPRFIQSAVTGMTNALPVSSRDISFDFKAKQFLYGARFPPVIRNQVWLGAFHQEEQDELFCKGGVKNPLWLVNDVMRHCRSSHPGDRILYFYQKFYLCDDILVKTDRASMASSLEVRAPFLDVNLVEYVSSLPFEMKLKGRATKYILKKALEKILPSSIIYRKKKGFGIPIAVWFRNELKGLLLSQLNRGKIGKEGIFNPDCVDGLVGEHLSGKKNNRKQLFSLLMFEWWRERYL